ncbi:hypothetical protein EBZ80_05495 [bacterium]|nr:hypothetical protein [bacterium]
MGDPEVWGHFADGLVDQVVGAQSGERLAQLPVEITRRRGEKNRRVWFLQPVENPAESVRPGAALGVGLRRVLQLQGFRKVRGRKWAKVLEYLGVIPEQDVLGLERVQDRLVQAVAVKVWRIKCGRRLGLVHPDAAEKQLPVAYEERNRLLAVEGRHDEEFFAGREGFCRVLFGCGRGGDCLPFALAVEADRRESFPAGVDGGVEFNLIDELGVQRSYCRLLAFLVIGIGGLDAFDRRRGQPLDRGGLRYRGEERDQRGQARASDNDQGILV